ncbi:MAG TPA: hypothetical protein VN690_08230 [Terriglobales bacterium]|nr:hypothetical protein [Terriglobales bacterium]
MAAASTSSRLGSAASRVGRIWLGRFWLALRSLALRFAAALYLAFAASFAVEGVRGWIADHHRIHHAFGVSQLSGVTQLELALALVFLYFGVTSWLRS